MRTIILGLTLLLAACGNSSPPPPPPPVVSSAIALGPSAAWAITQGSPGVQGRSLSNGAFDFPQCASASICWASYVEAPLAGNIAALNSITLAYTITGDSPIFVNDSPGNAGAGPPALSLYFHRGDDPGLTNPMGRWFSTSRQNLARGSHTFTVSLDDLAQWTPVYPPGNAAAFSAALANVGSVGVVFGGGYFAGHGAAVISGSARFILNSFTVQ